VVIHHTVPGWPHAQVSNLIGQYGPLGVSFFFVLSGFVLMWSFNPRVTPGEFILRRLIRIYPLHLLCLVLSLLAFAFLRTPLAGYIGSGTGTVLNFLLLHGWVPGHQNIRQAWNGVSWTLSCEFFFYLTAAWIFPRLLQRRASARLVVLAVLWGGLAAVAIIAQMRHGEALLDFLWYHPIPHLLDFYLGATIAQLARNGQRPLSRAVGLLLIILPIGVYPLLAPSADHLIPVLGVLTLPGFVYFILAVAQRDLLPRRAWSTHPWLVRLGEASFALYITHALCYGLVFRLKHHYFPVMTLAQGEITTLLFTLFAVAVSLVVYTTIEVPVRHALTRWLLKKA
jgi:peptidoglycan/LPS O-acetylase OafA/YrhL